MLAPGINMKLKLIHKLLIAMFACTALVLVLITLITRASIGRGFIDFLQQQERNRVEILVPDLEAWYSEHESWDDLANEPRQFYYLVLNALFQESDTSLDVRSERPSLTEREGRRGSRFPGSGPGRQGPGIPGFGGGPGSGPGGRNALPQRVFLLAADKTPVVGEIPADIDEDGLLPISAGGTAVGWLGVAYISSISLPEEQAFITQLRNNLLIGLGTGLLVAALLAWLLARHLSRPINHVANGIRRLAAGEFGSRLKTQGSDEIARLGDDVDRLATVLGESEASRKRAMSDIAHELRTPLAIISGELEAISDGIRPLNKEQLDSVREEVKHLSILVDDLRNLTLTDSGALAYTMKSVNLDDVVQMSVASFKAGAEKKNLGLNYTSPGQDVRLQGDEQRLRQWLHNLLDNSVRYTDAGGRISVVLEKHRQQAVLTISDSTPGASMDECEHMFERLYRLETSRNRNSGGSGLGLAICRNIVEAHGGNITAAPGPEGGLLITTTLPVD